MMNNTIEMEGGSLRASFGFTPQRYFKFTLAVKVISQSFGNDGAKEVGASGGLLNQMTLAIHV